MIPGTTVAPRWRASPLPYGLSLRWRLAIVALAALFVFVVTQLGSVRLVALLVVGPVAALLIWRWPIASIFVLVTFGPIHEFLMLLVFRVVGASSLLKAAELWKEIIVVVLVLKALDLALRRRQAPKLYLVDLGILIFFAYAALYLAYPSILPDSTFISKVYGLRADAFFMVAYFIGRGIPLTAHQVRRLLIVFMAVSFVIALVAAVQFALPGPSNAFFNSLGLNAFLYTERGPNAATELVNFREDVGYILVPRAASLVLSTLALAFYSLLAAPLAAALFITLTRTRDKLVLNFLVLATVGTTLATVTRSAIIAVVPALALLVVRTGRLIRFFIVAAEGAAIVVPIALALGVTPQFLQSIFSLNEGSAQSHVSAFEQSIAILRAYPFGRGLGTAGGTGQLFEAAAGITTEDWYLQIATEIGIIAAVIFGLILIGIGITAFRRYGHVRDPWIKGLCLGMGGATIGFIVEGFGLHVWEAETISLIFWLFAGLVVQAPSIDATREGR